MERACFLQVDEIGMGKRRKCVDDTSRGYSIVGGQVTLYHSVHLSLLFQIAP